MQSSSSFVSLPRDNQIQILSLLSPEDVLNFRLVSHECRKAAENDRIWKYFLFTDQAHLHPDKELGVCKSWREFWLQNLFKFDPQNCGIGMTVINSGKTAEKTTAKKNWLCVQIMPQITKHQSYIEFHLDTVPPADNSWVFVIGITETAPPHYWDPFSDKTIGDDCDVRSSGFVTGDMRWQNPNGADGPKFGTGTQPFKQGSRFGVFYSFEHRAIFVINQEGKVASARHLHKNFSTENLSFMISVSTSKNKISIVPPVLRLKALNAVSEYNPNNILKAK